MTAELCETAACFDAAPARRYRGRNKGKRWTRGADIELAVIRLPLDVHDPGIRHRTEGLFWAMRSVKRALQRDGRDAVDAYWAGDVRRERDAKVWRLQLGLSREGMERRAYRHMENSRHLAHHVTKALVMHQADEVFETSVSRHLLPDSSGRRHGRPRAGRWWDYTRIPGRARSHTISRKWETFRLHGTLAGHLDTYRNRNLDHTVTTPEQAAALSAGTGVLEQPRHLPAPMRPTGRIQTGEVTAKDTTKTRAATWWDHTGPLVVVFTGGAGSRRGDLVLSVRLPSGSGRWPRLVHFLTNPGTWHKIDLVRRRDTSAPGGWAYEAHLMVLTGGYASPATKARRAAAAALERVGGIDGNVSNLSIVSFPTPSTPPTATSKQPASSQATRSLPRWRKPAARTAAAGAPWTAPAERPTPASTGHRNANRPGPKGARPRAFPNGSSKRPAGQGQRTRLGCPSSPTGATACQPASGSTGLALPKPRPRRLRQKTTAPAASPKRSPPSTART
ncbi:hypothetical protein [Streptomyces sp. CA-106110]|uniref:hypothetical protein n=1 Tax=Streptomyces sp. CA-106110 TaxID=3240044 RepID=UPI003D90701F